MKTRKLGHSDLDLTVIGFGAWAIGGSGWSYGWGKQDDDDSVSAIHAALDAGVNWIDTAHVYGLGHSEEVVGRALARGRRDGVIVATKCGLIAADDGFSTRPSLKAESVRKEIDGSLRRLRVDVIDLYQIHWAKPEEDIEEAWEEIARAVEVGKIRYAGVSNFSPEQMKAIAPIARPVSLQPPYSMLRRAIEDDHVPYCHENDIGIVAYSPMQSGLLTGKVTKEWAQELPEDDWRSRTAELQEPNLSVNIAFVEDTLRPIADAHGVDPGQVAVAWTLRGDLITSAIVGARTPKQIQQTVRAADVTLSEEDLDKIEVGLKKRAVQLK